MLTPPDTDLTLPSIRASLGRNHGAEELVITVVFHPDASRIGCRAVVPKHVANAPWVLGRRSPDFHHVDEPAASPLEDPHVSRRALQFSYSGKELTINRFESANRCRVGSTELFDRVELDAQQLRCGVPLLLGHSIVLMLRLSPTRESVASKTERGDLLLGSSNVMEGIREQIKRAAESDVDVLILGETGTGKELVATAIHRAGRRARKPMVSVNMAAISSELAAAALFGSVRGAFTGADKAVPGFFEQAQGGCLLLDEIGDTPAPVQPLLLRALQEREIQAVGGRVQKVDVRVISATDADLSGEGCDFKAALRHRLGACEILLPPLRAHPEDIGELLRHFLRISAAESRRGDPLPDMQSPALDIAAWAILFLNFVCYSWPGNVRELANFAQQVILASDKAPVVSEHLRARLAAEAGQQSAASRRTARAKMQDIEDDTFEAAMASNGFEIQRVAQYLGVSRASIYRRIEASSDYRLVGEISEQELQNVLTELGEDSAAVARQLRVPVDGLRTRLRKLRLDWH